MHFDETLYQTTLQIKQDLDLILDRIEKMELHSAEVSEQVYQRVKKDYLVQLSQIKTSFEQKCIEIEKALQNLYSYKKEQETYLQKNKEIFEEAKFRHVLGEYPEEKFQEVKNQTDSEVANYENILNDLQIHINQYEALIEVRQKLSSLAPSLLPNTPAPVVTDTKAKEVETVSEKTLSKKAEPVFEPIHTSPPSAPAPAAPVTAPSTPKQTEANPQILTNSQGDYFSDSGGNYFNDDAVQAIEQAAAENKKTVEKPEKKKASPPPAPPVAELSFDDSISAILKSIPLDDLDLAEPEAKNEEKFESTEDRHSSSHNPVIDQDPPTGKQSLSALAEEDSELLPDLPDVEEESVSMHAKLICLEGDVEPKEIELSETISIGRSPSNDVVLKEAKVSRQHAAINKQNNEYILIDLKSSNGVYVNGTRVEEQTLKDGDQISIGSFKMLFQRF